MKAVSSSSPTAAVRRVRAAALTVVLLVMAACGDGSITDPQFEPEVTNIAGSFELQATGVSGITETLSYSWQNSATTANVDQSGSITAGTATLRIRDAAGTTVYTGNLASTGSVSTSAGTAGTWTIQLVLQDMTGTLNFRVQTP